MRIKTKAVIEETKSKQKKSWAERGKHTETQVPLSCLAIQNSKKKMLNKNFGNLTQFV